METLNSSGKRSSSRASPWLDLDSGEARWDDFDQRSKDEIVRHYSPKIKIMALRLKSKLPQSVELGELISAGSLGLMEALRKFNPVLRIKFETYAESRIKGAMLDELRRMDWFSRGLRQRMRVIESAAQEIERETGTGASVEQISARTGISTKDVESGMEMLENQLCLSLDAVTETLAGGKGEDDCSDPYHNAAMSQVISRVTELIAELTPREQMVLALYYGEELNMRETAEAMEITEGRVSQLHSQALVKLRKKFKQKYNVEAG